MPDDASSGVVLVLIDADGRAIAKIEVPLSATKPASIQHEKVTDLAEPYEAPRTEPGVANEKNEKAFTPDPRTSVVPEARDVPRVTPVIEAAGGNWDFEEGLDHWTASGEAFATQPTLGDNVVAARVRTDMRLDRGGIGGDYWTRIPYPVGHHGAAWIGTYENHPAESDPHGRTQGDAATGTLTSGTFPLDEAHRFIAFSIGGGSDVASVRVELQVRGRSEEDLRELDRLVAGNRDGNAALAAIFGGAAPGARGATAPRDGDHVVALTATGRNSELMRPVVFEVPATLRVRSGRIRIVDHSEGAWGHVNADDFRFGATRPRDRAVPVWGFADTHAHPMNDLAFGGNLVQGSLYARDGSPPQSERHRRTAIPPLFENLQWAQLGAGASLAGPLASANVATLSALLAPLFPGTTTMLMSLPPIDPLAGAAAAVIARDATRPARMGYPNMRSYPGFGQMLGQTAYGEWIFRAYEGGLRLMSALAVNTWLVSSHPVKRLLLGTSAPEDDKRSADAQVADVKAWALRPENRAWVEVALTPADARRIIGENKLAVVIGLELDVLGNFLPDGDWTEPGAVVMPAGREEQRALIAAELDRLYAQGVRQVGPFHYASGVFGGCAMFQRMFNEINRKFTGDNVQTDSGEAEGIRYRLDLDGWDNMGIASRIAATGHDPSRHSDPSWGETRGGHINRMGLTPAGEILFEELARLGMLIDIDHASYKSTKRLLQLAEKRDYPVLSSHSDFIELGFTGAGEFTHGPASNNHEENARRFDTTILAPLRNEGMSPRSKVEKIAALGGVSAPIMWLPRRETWAGAVPNDCDGSSKTWAQSYQYAVEVSGGRGIALSSDRITLEPRFGPNAAYLLGVEDAAMPRRDQRRFEQVHAQRNGVRYDVPLVEGAAFRFAAAGPSAWQKTPLPGDRDRRRAVRRVRARRQRGCGGNGSAENHGFDGTIDPTAVPASLERE